MKVKEEKGSLPHLVDLGKAPVSMTREVVSRMGSTFSKIIVFSVIDSKLIIYQAL